MKKISKKELDSNIYSANKEIKASIKRVESTIIYGPLYEPEPNAVNANYSYIQDIYDTIKNLCKKTEISIERYNSQK